MEGSFGTGAEAVSLYSRRRNCFESIRGGVESPIFKFDAILGTGDFTLENKACVDFRAE
ncbi:MAG: hypothetical protein ACLTXL_04860 [Clostridia bacterium]